MSCHSELKILESTSMKRKQNPIERSKRKKKELHYMLFTAVFAWGHHLSYISNSISPVSNFITRSYSFDVPWGSKSSRYYLCLQYLNKFLKSLSVEYEISPFGPQTQTLCIIFILKRYIHNEMKLYVVGSPFS